MLRILVSAYACEPGRGSEPGVGWTWVREIARSNQVWVLTRSNNRAAIEKALAAEPMPNARWIYLDLPAWARFWKRKHFGIHLYYVLWQLAAYFQAKKLHKQVEMHIVHHLTFGNYWMPSFLSFLPVPFVWGPLGGAEAAPRSFWTFFSARGKAHEVTRSLARRLADLSPLVRITARRAAVILSKSEETKKHLEDFGANGVVVYSEVGVRQEEIRQSESFPPRQEDVFRLLSLGNLIHWKGFELALEAFARFHRQYPTSEYWLVGDGPERKRLEGHAQQLGVAQSVRFLGKMPRSEVLKVLEECDVLVHPSLHDSGGWACVEAMTAGRPVICLDLGGPALQITPLSGIKVPAETPRQVIGDLTQAMTSLAQDRVLCASLGEGARRRVRDHFGWDKKAEWINGMYLAGLTATGGDPQPDRELGSAGSLRINEKL